MGSIGRRHLQNLVTLGHKDIVLYRTGLGQATGGERDAQDFRSVVPGDAVKIETRLSDALAHQPSAVLVTNPTSLHLETALAAVRAGCAVLIEKPVSHTLDGLEPLLLEVERQRVAVLVGYQFRFDPGLQHVRAWVADGAIGSVVSARAHWGEWLPGWHPAGDYQRGYSARRALGGGVVLTLSHPLDYLLWILGEVDAVTALTARRSGLNVDVEDAATIALRFVSGALGTVTLDYAERPPCHRLSITGTEGRIAWDAAGGTARLIRVRSNTNTIARPPRGHERNAPFLEELRHFLACLGGRETPRCTLGDGVRVVEIALAALRSAQEARTITLA